MIKWITDNQDLCLFILMVILVSLGVFIGRETKNEEIRYIINDYENLLELAHADRQNLMISLASMQARNDGQYLGIRANSQIEPFVFDSNCTCSACDQIRRSM